MTDILDLINTGTGLETDKVTVHSFSKQQDENHSSPKTNYATNTLDKDNGTVWAADDDAVLSGDYKGDGEYIIYDLGSVESLKMIQFTTTDKSDAFGFQIWTSTTSTSASDFSKVLPVSEDLLLTETGTTDFNQYQLETEARYVKLIGFGRFNSDGNTRKSVWSAVGEIELYGASNLSVNDTSLQNKILLYPNPVKDVLFIQITNQKIKEIQIYSIEGRKIMEKSFFNTKPIEELNVSSLKSGFYIVNINNGQKSFLRKIIISD